MFGVGNGDAGAVCVVCSGLALKTPGRRHWLSAGLFIVGFARDWGLALVFLLFTLGQVNASWVFVILMTKFFLTNDIFDWFIHFVVIFCSIRLFFTVNITNFNNYLIYIMKLQVFMVLCSVLKSPLVLGSSFVETSQFLSIAGSLAGFCMVRVFG